METRGANGYGGGGGRPEGAVTGLGGRALDATVSPSPVSSALGSLCLAVSVLHGGSDPEATLASTGRPLRVNKTQG